MRMMMKTLREAGLAAWWRHGLLPVLLVAGLPLLAQDSETIVKVEVVGASKQTPETVIYKSGLKVGDDLRSVDLHRGPGAALGLRRLRRHQVRGGGRRGRQEAHHPGRGAAADQGSGLPGRHRASGSSSLKDKIKDKKLHRPGHGLRPGDRSARSRLHRGTVRREGLPEPGGRRGARAHRPGAGPPGLRHQGGRQGQDLQDHLQGQHGLLQLQARSRS